MPVVRKLSGDEVRTLETKPLGERGRVVAEYDTYLLDFAQGDYGEVQLDEGDNRLTIRNRLQAAAARRQLALSFRRTTGPKIRFQIVAASIQAVSTNGEIGVVVVKTPASSVSDSVTAPTDEIPKRRGRPPRTETTVTAAPEVSAPPRRGRPPKAELVDATPAVAGHCIKMGK